MQLRSRFSLTTTQGLWDTAGCRVCPNILQRWMQGSLCLLVLPEIRAGGVEPPSESWKTRSGFPPCRAISQIWPSGSREMLGDPGFLAVTAELCGQARRTWHGVEVGGMCPHASGILLSYSWSGQHLGFYLFFLSSLYSDATRFLAGWETNFGSVNAVNTLGIFFFFTNLTGMFPIFKRFFSAFWGN